ncbi:hypothetical protein KORDIASMS9_02383 [Kordia sp. SMS9]|nr:hypothetical protein KORDIASMS9_02383 [Kordia sp. SMS9]
MIKLDQNNISKIMQNVVFLQKITNNLLFLRLNRIRVNF